MKYFLLYVAFFLLNVGCKKSSSPPSLKDSASQSSNDESTISHAVTGNWSFLLNGITVSGFTNTCLMSQVSSNSPYQLVIGGSLTSDGYSLTIQMVMPSNTPVAGRYVAYLPSNGYNQIQIAHQYAEGSYTYYSSDSIVFNVVSYNEATRAVSATFAGNVNDGFSNISSITNGAITGVVQQ